jgi:putative flippase GtrA
VSWVWINVFGISKYVAPLINLVISIPLNFIINKFWAFRTQPES